MILVVSWWRSHLACLLEVWMLPWLLLYWSWPSRVSILHLGEAYFCCWMFFNYWPIGMCSCCLDVRYLTIHKNSSGIIMCMSKLAWHRWLLQTMQGNTVHTRHKHMTLTIELSNNPKCWVDNSYMIHPELKSQIGIYVTMGKGTKNLKLNALQRQN